MSNWEKLEIFQVNFPGKFDRNRTPRGYHQDFNQKLLCHRVFEIQDYEKKFLVIIFMLLIELQHVEALFAYSQNWLLGSFLEARFQAKTIL